MIKKSFGIFLLVVFFIEITPDALWHLLANHRDTNEVHTLETVYSEQHVHCFALQTFLPEFSSEKIFLALGISPVYKELVPVISNGVSHCFVYFSSNRGPPSLA